MSSSAPSLLVQLPEFSNRATCVNSPAFSYNAIFSKSGSKFALSHNSNPQPLKQLDICLNGHISGHTFRPEPADVIPPKVRVFDCPCHAIVAGISLTGDAMILRVEIREHCPEVVGHPCVYLTRPRSRPQPIQVSRIAPNRPASSGLTGSSPEIALSAQNQ